MSDIFQHGATWLRADFHLHTQADREFSYTGEANYYNSRYIDALEKAGIRVGVITNHNKFDKAEFVALRKTAEKKSIFLLPGIELSVGDGANGIHTLIVFSDEWLVDGQDHINSFLTIAFEGKTHEQYENENGRSSLGLIETIKKLEGYHKDFFLVFAHVEQKSGLWDALEGGRLQELGSNEVFRIRASNSWVFIYALSARWAELSRECHKALTFWSESGHIKYPPPWPWNGKKFPSKSNSSRRNEDLAGTADRIANT